MYARDGLQTSKHECSIVLCKNKSAHLMCQGLPAVLACFRVNLVDMKSY